MGLGQKIERDPQYVRAIAAAGDVGVVAIALGVTRDSIHRWTRIPAEYVLRLEQLTGIPGCELRPDMYLPLNPVPETVELRRKQLAILKEAGNLGRATRGSTRPPASPAFASPQTKQPPAGVNGRGP